MKRIFSSERLCRGLFFTICTFLYLALILYAEFYSAHAPKKIGVEFLGVPAIFLIALHYLTAHVSFDSEKLVSWTIYRRKTVFFENIIQITRKWNSGGKGGACLSYILCYMDREKGREKTILICLPSKYESKKVQTLISQMKIINHNFEFFVEV